MAETFLVAQDLHKSFDEHKAVNGVSFTIYKAQKDYDVDEWSQLVIQ